jgi:methionyl-tRNA formyltransferase
VATACGVAACEAWECENINDPSAVGRLADARADVMVVADFGQFIKAPARAAMRVDAINLHGSLLPELRGAAPINWAIIRGYKTTGVTTFSLVGAMDAGDVYLQESLAIDPAWTAQELREQLAGVGAGVVGRTLDLLVGGQAVRRAQDHAKATLAPILKKGDGIVDWSQDATAIRNRIHGCWPWPGAQSVFVRADGHETPVTIARAEVIEHGTVAGRAEDMPAVATAGGGMAPGAGVQLMPGAVTADLAVATGHGGTLRLLELKPAGKRLMAWRDFVNGHRVAEGDRFIAHGAT